MKGKINLFSGKFPEINTGKGMITLWTMLSIWSISTVTSLPGLAVSPILGKLDTVFKNVSDLEIQMLTSLPNLMIVPFVLLSGKLTESKGKLPMLIIGLSLFLLSGILYFFANSMNTLIIISCFLGMGAGMIIPLSTGLIADFFVGNYRTKQMGLSSGINNLTLVLATFLTGWLANINWHLPFAVYLIPVFSLLLVRFLTDGYLKKEGSYIIGQGASKGSTMEQIHMQEDSDSKNIYLKPGQSLDVKKMMGLMLLYFSITYLSIMGTFNISFVLQEYKLSSTYSGTIISIYFLAITIPGFCLPQIMKILKKRVVYLCFAMVAIGLFLVVLFKITVIIGVGFFLMGFGIGILQPLIYDKTSLIATSKRTIFALAVVMCGNYIAIILCPFIGKLFQIIFHQQGNMLFPFWVNAFLALIIMVLAFFRQHKFVFSNESSSLNR